MSMPTTTWSQVLQAGRGASTALEELVNRYLEPVYAYVRASGVPAHEAEDLSHDFFIHLLESTTLAQAQPERGRFRAYLTTCLRHFLTDQARRRGAHKRGGDRRHLQLDAEVLERSYASERETDPARVLLRRWAQATLDRALAGLNHQLSPRAAQVFQLAYGPDALSHEQIGARVGMKTNAVSATVSRARKKLRAQLLAQVRETVASDEEAEAELEELLAAISL